MFSTMDSLVPLIYITNEADQTKGTTNIQLPVKQSKGFAYRKTWTNMHSEEGEFA
jgi:hypothetical protein